ncbi:MAG: TolC family protein [Pirellulales bacterium]
MQRTSYRAPLDVLPGAEVLPPYVSSVGLQLTLSDLEQMAMSNNPSMAEASARVDAARGKMLQVGLPPNLAVGYSGQQIGSQSALQQGVYLEQEFVTGGKLSLNRRVASWELEQAQRQFTAQRMRVLTDVRLAYYSVVIAQRRCALTAQLVAVGEHSVDAAEALLQGQEVGQSDPLRARIEADIAGIASQNAENQYRAAWRTMAAVVGVPDMPIAAVQGDVEPEVLQGTWDETLGQLLVESPELDAAIAQVEAARWAYRRARVEMVPNIDVQAIVQHDNSVDGTNGNLQVSVPIPLLNRNQGGVRQAQAELAAADRAVDRLALALQARLADSFQRYESAQNRVQKYERSGGILDNAAKSLDLIEKGYAAGEFGVVDLLTAQRTYFQVNLAYLDSLQDMWVAVTEIRGLQLSGSLQQ